MKNKKLFTNLSTSAYYELYRWCAPSRIWNEKSREWYIAYSAFFIFWIIIAVLLGQLFFVLAIVAFSFLWFVQAMIPPENIHHFIMNSGIKSFEELIRWSEIKHFWFSKKSNLYLLNLETYPVKNNPNMLSKRISLIVVDEPTVKEIFEILERFVDYGDKMEVSYNLLTQIILGDHVSMDTFISDSSV